MAVWKLHSVKLVPQYFHNYAFNFNGTRAGHVMISGSPSVTRTVCSK